MLSIDLILLTWNHLEITQRCLESLFSYVDIPSRLVIVDNGSDQPGVREYLQTVTAKGKIQEVIVLQNEEDFGFSKGMNRGLQFCLANNPKDYFCLVSNDVVATQGWLSELVRIAQAQPDIGFVNPNSTNFGFYPPGRDKKEKKKAINEYGMRISQSSKGKWQELGSCVGFCFLVKKEVLDKIGLFDEVYGMAYYEDADLSKRAQSAGYLCALAEASYVYHEQGSSFGKRQEKSPLFLKNEEIFYSRWKMQRPGRICYIIDQPVNRTSNRLQEKLRRTANEFNKVWILCRDKDYAEVIPNHWNIQKVFLLGSALFFSWRAWLYLVFKKKKFDLLFVDNPDLIEFLRKTQNRYQTEFYPI